MKKEDKHKKFIRIRSEVRAAKLKNYSEYEAIRTKKKWPSRPEREFAKDGWKGWVDFLDCETKKEMFARVKKEVRKANVANYSEYEAIRNENDWPSRPEREFEGYGWKGWEDYFGKKLPKRKAPTTKETRIPFTILQEKVKKLGIENWEDYKKEAKKHPDWPSVLQVYEEFTTFGEFAQVEEKYISLDQLRKEVQEHRIVLKKNYLSIRKKKKMVHWPRNPSECYSDWRNWGDLVGQEVTEPIKKVEILPYKILKYFVQKAGITSYKQYEQERKNHEGWVSNPYRHYTKTGDWKSYPDLFGTK